MDPHSLDRGDATPCPQCRKEHSPGTPCRYLPLEALVIGSLLVIVAAAACCVAVLLIT